MATKKIGIGADNFKVSKFEEELAEAGFKDVSVKPFTKHTSMIFIIVDASTEEATVKKIHAICIKVDAHFKRTN